MNYELEQEEDKEMMEMMENVKVPIVLFVPTSHCHSMNNYLARSFPKRD
jgi:hypothetical protein